MTRCTKCGAQHRRFRDRDKTRPAAYCARCHASSERDQRKREREAKRTLADAVFTLATEIRRLRAAVLALAEPAPVVTVERDPSLPDHIRLAPGTPERLIADCWRCERPYVVLNPSCPYCGAANERVDPEKAQRECEALAERAKTPEPPRTFDPPFAG
jgi:hypothetical protein